MPNYSIKFVLKPEKANAVGMVPIYLRTIIERKTTYMATGYYIPESMWNDKTQKIRDGLHDAKSMNLALTHKKSEVIQKITGLQVAGKTISSKIIKEHFSGKDLNNIFNFIDAFCIEVKHKKDEQTIIVYQNHARKLQKFWGSRNLNFEDITTAFLAKYENHLRELGASNNYVHAIWKTLKTFFNAAKKKKLISAYPFDQYENPIYVQPQKDRLTLEELDRWEEFVDTATNKVWKQAGVYFLLGCYTGLRVSDWRVFNPEEHIVNGMLSIIATKNDEFVSVPISKPMERTIERIKQLPLSIEEPTINEKLKEIARAIKLQKRITTHSGRHTFAITICAEQGISCEVCAKLMGITFDTCEKNYYRTTALKIHAETIKAWSGLK